MTTIAVPTGAVTVGVDTHLDVHVAAVIDGLGRMLGSAGFATSPAGNRQLIRWAERHGKIGQVGVEGTGSYGAQLTRDLQQAGHQVVEVDGPDRKTRRTRGKDDHLDAEAAARAVLSGRASTTPKTRAGGSRRSAHCELLGAAAFRPYCRNEPAQSPAAHRTS